MAELRSNPSFPQMRLYHPYGQHFFRSIPQANQRNFGVGMGCREATCGALIAVEILMGHKEYQGKPVLRNARELHQAFTEKCGASICKDLKGRDTGVIICECDNCVRCAVDLAEGIIQRP